MFNSGHRKNSFPPIFRLIKNFSLPIRSKNNISAHGNLFIFQSLDFSYEFAGYNLNKLLSIFQVNYMVFLLLILVYISVCILWNIVFKSTLKLRLASVITAAVSAFGLTLVFKSTASAELLTQILTALQKLGLPVDIILENSGLYGDVLVKFIAALVSPIVFIALFISFDLIFFLLRVIVFLLKALLFRSKKKPKIFTRVVFGTIQGLITVFCFLLPIAVYIEIASAIAPEIPEITSTPQEETVLLQQNIDKANNSTIIKTYRNLGGNLLSGALTDIEITSNDNTVTKVKLSDEIGAVAAFCVDISKLGKTPVSEYGEEENSILSDIGTALTDSKVIAEIACNVIHEATDAWSKGETFAGVAKPQLDPKLDPLLDKIIEILNTSSENPEYLGEDINTIASIFRQLHEAGVFDTVVSGGDITAVLQNSNVMSDLISTVNANPRMRTLIPVLTNLGLSLVTDSLGLPGIDDEAYSEMVTNVTNDLTANKDKSKEERVASMSITLNQTLTENGFTGLGEFELNVVSDALITYFDNGGTIPESLSEDDISAFFGLVMGN